MTKNGNHNDNNSYNDGDNYDNDEQVDDSYDYEDYSKDIVIKRKITKIHLRSSLLMFFA